MLRSLLLIILFTGFTGFSQDGKAKPNAAIELENLKNDTNKVLKLNDYAWELRSNPDSAIKYSKKALNASLNIKWNIGIGESYHQLGIFYLTKGDYTLALNSYTKALSVWDRMIKHSTGANKDFALTKRAKTLGNIGNVYLNQGLHTKAVENFLMALKINEFLKNYRLQAVNLGNLGIVYKKQKEYKKALTYYFKTLQITKGSDYLQTYANTLGNIGLVYSEMKNFNSALVYNFKALELAKQNNYTVLEENTLGNIGLIYAEQAQFSKAIEFNLNALKIAKDIGDKIGEAYHLSNIGNLYMKTNDLSKSKAYLEAALKLSSDIEDLEIQKDVYYSLAKLYEKTGKGIAAYQSLEKYIQFNDSIENEENIKEQSQLEAKFEYDRKASADSIGFEKEKEIKNVEIEKQKVQIKAKRNQQYALFGGLALVIIFAGFIFNRFKITQKQKQIIEVKEQETQKQKHIIEEKHKEITDSINYAERIQRSFLATKDLLDEHLKDYFVFFKPKDVVSGDFYWGSSVEQGFCLITADSTGHGVPGAIMSLLNITSIDKAIEKTSNPAEILNATRKTIIERLKKDGSPEGGKDGMDCSAIVFDSRNKKLHIAAANNPVWIIRNDPKKLNTLDLVEIKPDKMPVGKSDKETIPFTLNTVTVEPGDLIYTLTDGFPDQFGGPKGKKFMSKNLKELLLNNAGLPMFEQKELLETAFKNWIKNLEQVDDVTVIGVRI